MIDVLSLKLLTVVKLTSNVSLNLKINTVFR